MKYLITTSILTILINGKEESHKILEELESMIQSNKRFYATALSIFEVMQTKSWGGINDQKEFLHQSGILCEEIYPVTLEDLKFYSNIKIGDTPIKGLEWIELSVAVNRGMDTLLVYGFNLESNPWISVIDLKSKSKL